MIQMEFQEFTGIFSAPGAGCGRVRAAADTAIDYTVRLSGALRVFALTHALHDVLSAVAKLEALHGHATIPGVAARLFCTYQCVVMHLHRNAELFEIEDASPRRVRLSAESIRLLVKLKQRTRRHE